MAASRVVVHFTRIGTSAWNRELVSANLASCRPGQASWIDVEASLGFDASAREVVTSHIPADGKIDAWKFQSNHV